MKNRVLPLFVAAILVAVILSSSVAVAAAEPILVYLGGFPIGIGLAEDGLIITGMVDVITDEGAICPARGTEILTGDVVLAVDGERISGIGDFAKRVQRASGEVTLTLKRGESEYDVALTPVTDTLTGLKKLGLTLKSGINGIGTLTFATKDGSYGALGHGIVDADTGKTFVTDAGSIYSCRINGYKRGKSGVAGELSGTFLNRDTPIGTITRCNEFGVYGKIEKTLVESREKLPVASIKEVKTGDATIYSTIHGETPKAYSIEIVKTVNQKRAQEKSMLIRVTDQELLAETGGILQGMSGSPIVQNGKLVGAVTHVLVNDSTLGYGIYLDWMLENLS